MRDFQLKTLELKIVFADSHKYLPSDHKRENLTGNDVTPDTWNITLAPKIYYICCFSKTR